MAAGVEIRKIKLCPFCNQLPALIDTTGAEYSVDRGYRFVCCILETDLYRSVDELSTAWNARAGDQSERDRDWILAIAGGLGENSGHTIPIVPDPALFRKLFDVIKTGRPNRYGGDTPIKN